jgi:hypothetical protein
LVLEALTVVLISLNLSSNIDLMSCIYVSRIALISLISSGFFCGCRSSYSSAEGCLLGPCFA